MKDKKKIFFPNLDGWRFIAFLAVFYHHSYSTQFDYIKDSQLYYTIKGTTRNGNLGVDFFFVLSGFLIIYLLISEKEMTGKIDAKNFYIRRILRIFPLYYFCVFFGFVIFPFAKSLLGGTPDENAHLPFYLVFLNNLDMVRNGVLPDGSMLGILWSVAIEEQFYLTIPFILILIPVRFYKWVFAGVILISWIFRANFIGNEFVMTFHTLSFVGNLAIGGLIAYYSATSDVFVKFFENLNKHVIKLIYVAVIVIFLFRWQIFIYPFMWIFDTSIIAALFALIILEQNYSKNSFYKMKNNRLFSSLGKYTYGLYCLHTIAALIVLQITNKLHLNIHLWQVVLLETPLIFILSVIFAYISYQFYEKPFLKLKDSFSFITKNQDVKL